MEDLSKSTNTNSEEKRMRVDLTAYRIHKLFVDQTRK